MKVVGATTAVKIVCAYLYGFPEERRLGTDCSELEGRRYAINPKSDIWTSGRVSAYGSGSQQVVRGKVYELFRNESLEIKIKLSVSYRFIYHWLEKEFNTVYSYSYRKG